MNITDPIINAALLGTANRLPAAGEFPPALAATIGQLPDDGDAETAFYRMAALAFAYRRAGMEPDTGEAATALAEAPEEALPYFADETGELLARLLPRPYLLLYAYRLAAEQHRLLPPACLPPLIAHAYDPGNPHRAEEQARLAALAGARGRWLLPLMGLPDWGRTSNEPWETAPHKERIRLLAALRETAPGQGLARLQAGLKDETAAHRDELIACLATNLGKADEPFLQSVARTDRSTNVRETARRLLCRIPDSEIVKTCEDLLRGKLKHNLLLGWSYGKIGFTPEMKELGLKEISPYPNEKDETYLLRQLAERVPLGFWADLYGCPPERAAEKLAKKPPFGPHFDLWVPIRTFGDNLWAYHTLKTRATDTLITRLLGLLTPAQREAISLGPLAPRQYSRVYDWLSLDGAQWGPRFSKEVVRYLRSFQFIPDELAERLAVHLAPEAIPLLEQQAALHEEHPAFAAACRSIVAGIAEKEKINQSLTPINQTIKL